jgi:alpha-beta hydrolase superfamily lysophospholipase
MTRMPGCKEPFHLPSRSALVYSNGWDTRARNRSYYTRSRRRCDCTPDRARFAGPGLFPKIGLGIQQKLEVLFLQRARPELNLSIPLVPDDYTRNAAYLEYIRHDSYRQLAAFSRFFWETRRLDRAHNRLAGTVRLPMLLQIGDADLITDAAKTCRWFQRLDAPDHATVVYRDASHTLDPEPYPNVRAYRADLLGWLRHRIERAAS